MRYVATIATGKDYYIRLAENLCLSFLYWNKTSGIQFVVLTDRPELFDKTLTDNIKLINISGSNQSGFLSKFNLVNFLEDGEVLFLDSDCLVYGPLTPFFDRNTDKPFLAFGKNHSVGEGIGYCKDIPALLEKLNLKYYPIVTGSLYYYNDFVLAKRIIEHAKYYSSLYDDLGFIRLRSTFNEEPLIGIGMSMESVMAYPDDGLSKGDLMYFDHLQSDVLKGEAFLWNDTKAPVPFVTDLMESSPIAVHFDGINTQFFPYRSEVYKLRVWHKWGLSAPIARLGVDLIYTYPNRLKAKCKDILRPVWHSMFGPSKVKNSLR